LIFELGLTTNAKLLAGIGGAVAITLVLIYVPPLASLFALERLPRVEWLLIAAFAPAVLLLEETRKTLLRLYKSDIPWDSERYPVAMRHLGPEVREKAIEIANALLEEGDMEGKAIRIAIAKAKEWCRRRAFSLQS
jgi:Cation transporting ATPase, C-terminus